MRRGKRQLNVWLSEGAFRGWTNVCDKEGIDSLTAMVEAIGLAFDRGDLPVPSAAWPVMCEEARSIAVARRRRGRETASD